MCSQNDQTACSFNVRALCFRPSGSSASSNCAERRFCGSPLEAAGGSAGLSAPAAAEELPVKRFRLKPTCAYRSALLSPAAGFTAITMVLLENDAFLTELTRLFQKCRTSGSVVITLKKYDGRTKPAPRKGHPETFEPADNKCLIRASEGKKKISTVVSTKEVIKFQMAYSNLLRAHMDGLKKKDKKSKSKKTKATQ
ncbi:hypothetical protein SRHO_G00132630 [Serrasalmus rhombeus]